jgi:hypothetical protein
VQQVDSRTPRRGPQSVSSSGLPQFDLQQWDSFDPDRTLEKLPALTAAQVEPDMASTVEIVPEVSTGDILESRPAAPVLPPLVLPAPVSVPIDLDRLLARARAETSRSADFFRPATLTLSLTTEDDEPTPIPTTVSAVSAGRMPIVLPARKSRGPLAWALAAGMVVAVVAVGAAVGQVEATNERVARPVVTTAAAHVVSTPTVPSTPKVDPGLVVGAAAPDIPAVSVQNLPRVEAGTISLAAVAASHRLFIDGRLAPNGTATVSCGSHVVQVGSRGVRKRVDVPCGQEIVLAN